MFDIPLTSYHQSCPQPDNHQNKKKKKGKAEDDEDFESSSPSIITMTTVCGRTEVGYQRHGNVARAYIRIRAVQFLWSSRSISRLLFSSNYRLFIDYI